MDYFAVEESLRDIHKTTLYLDVNEARNQIAAVNTYYARNHFEIGYV